MASVQTYGDLDGTCMLAEYAMNEFSFKDGVIDRVSLKKKIEKLVPTLKMGLSIEGRVKKLNYAHVKN